MQAQNNAAAPLKVRLERVKGSFYRYDLSKAFHGDRGYFEIRQIRHSGATFDGWWEVSAGGDAAAPVALIQSLDEVRRFLAWFPSSDHRLMPERG